jgi:septum formation protein
MAIPKFVLASASPARRRLLQNIGIEPVVRPSNFDESTISEVHPELLVEKLAKSKAETVAEEFADAVVMGCDSVLVVCGEIQGKPATREEAIARWQQMRGDTGFLYTGHATIDTRQQKTLVRHQITQVTFARISDRQIEAYVDTGEPLKCAGSFALEGKGGLFVEKIAGCHTNVIGLSLPLLREMLQELGYDPTDYWQSS